MRKAYIILHAFLTFKLKTINILMNDIEHPKSTKPAEEAKGLIPVKKQPPNTLGIVVVEHRPFFPQMIAPLIVEGAPYQQAVKTALKTNPSYIGLFLSKDSLLFEEPEFKDIYAIGTVARVVRSLEQRKNNVQLLLDVVGRTKIMKIVQEKPFLVARVEHILEAKSRMTDETRAYSREILSNIKELVRLNPLIKEELSQLIDQVGINNPGRLADFAAMLTSADRHELQDILSTLEILPRLEKTLLIIKKELDLTRLQAKISKQIEEKISTKQKEFFLREQLKEIQKELGLRKDEKSQELDRWKKRAKKLKWHKEAQQVFDEELNKIAMLEPSSPEYQVSRGYLDWLTILPWGIYQKENYDLAKAKKILDQDHYGMEEVKERVLEFLATMSLRGSVMGNILCLVGPPGVGKTSVGRSIARALGRPFYRFSVGGMRDEAEIKGHRRTYIGAMPGKFLQAMKTVKKANPLIMLDEIDKIGSSYHGDPASALLEVLDPSQNSTFQDHYLDLGFDLSKVLFIATANQTDTISPALLDRMEIMHLAGYITQEKVRIAQRYLVPKQRKEHGLESQGFRFTTAALERVVEGYARETGVRQLENLIAKICRKVSKELVEQKNPRMVMGTKQVSTYLKRPVYQKENWMQDGLVGNTKGLAWTSQGGATLTIEAAKIPSAKSGFQQSGQLGKVMVESAEIAYSFVKAHTQNLKYTAEFFEQHSIHLHVPAGATPKDGPSAGITMATALCSLSLNTPIKRNLAMTGELTLSGRVLPIGGLKEKLLAAGREKLKIIIIPHDNQKEYEELPNHLKDGLEIHFVKHFKEVFNTVFENHQWLDD